jgi:hypothetical protein
MKRYRATLRPEELGRLLARGKADVRRLRHAQVLLKADEATAGPGWADERMAEALEIGLATVQCLRRRFVEEGLAGALSPYRGSKRVCATRLDGEQEAGLIALACSTPPEGHGGWTLRLLAGRMVELQHVDTLSHEMVRQVLKKRARAAPEKDVAHPAPALGRVRRPHGGSACGLPPSP